MMYNKSGNNICLFLSLVILISCSLLFNTVKAESAISRHDSDSLRSEINTCNTDTCRFQILQHFFWNYENIGFGRVKPIGRWAYEEIKNSKNLKARSDGLDILGLILENEQKYDSAKIVFHKALAIAEKIDYAHRIRWSYYHLAMLNRNLGFIDSALHYYRIVYNFDLNEGDLENLCDLTTQIARYFNELNEPDSAVFYFNKVLERSRQIGNTNREIYTFFDLARLYGNLNNIEKRVEYLNTALNLAEKSNDSEAIVKAYSNIADLFLTQKRNYDLALQYYFKALKNLPDIDKYPKASLNNSIASVYISKGMDRLALKYATEAFSLASSIKHKHEISESYLNLGKIYSMQGHPLKAINSYESCYKTGCDECPKIKFHNALIETADAYLNMVNKEKALEYYNLSLQLAIDFNSPAEQALSKLKLGNFYRKSNPTTSEKFYKEAYLNSRSSGDINIIKDIADTLASYYRNSRNYKAVVEYLTVAKSMGDSLRQVEQQATLAEWETRFEFEKLKAENESKINRSDIEIKRQKTYRNSAALIAFLLLILGWVIWRNYKNKKETVRQLEYKNKQIEEQNQEISTQVEEITSQKDEIERISNELHEADVAKLRFFTNLSHEFRTPLTLILNPAKNLLDSLSLDGDQETQVQYIYSNAQKLCDLTNQIMELQKLDAGMLQLTIENIDIIEYCVGIIASFESLCDTKKVSIRIESDATKAIAGFDKDKTGKILINLLSNAIKFCFEKSVIVVKIAISHNRFVLQVNDRGIGIPSAEVNNVFKRYVQASTNRNMGGTGIGLSYVKELATFMNGQVSLESVENKGTVISLEIPLSDVEIINSNKQIIEIAFRNNPEPVRTFDLAAYTEAKPEKPVVLLVEDNEQLRGFIAKLFRDEYNILVAGNGETGMEVAIKHVPDIIISDVMMPRKNGFELCALLKNDERTSHIPILLLTAKDGTQNSLEGYHTGADDYMVKPFENEILILKVRNILNTRAAISKQYNSELNVLPNTGAYSDVDKNFMKKCIQLIEQNIGNTDFTVDALASGLGFSRSNLYRKIISLTTFNPAELIRNIRMQHAARLFKNQNMRVNEVANEVGYDSAAKFSQAFKKHHGVLPSEMV